MYIYIYSICIFVNISKCVYTYIYIYINSINEHIACNIIILYINTLNVQDNNTALHLAADNGHTVVIKTLIEAGANVKARNNVSIGICMYVYRHLVM